jgi:hypothetical protein
VKHADARALDRLGGLLASLRTRPLLREKRPGIFYVGGRAFLHFHEDRGGLFADLRQRGEWCRLPVNGPADCRLLLDLVDRTLGPARGPGLSDPRPLSQTVDEGRTAGAGLGNGDSDYRPSQRYMH